MFLMGTGCNCTATLTMKSIEWEEYEQLLIKLAVRNGSKYNSVWYGEYWDKAFQNDGEAYFKCLICQEKIASCLIAALSFFRESMVLEAQEHGMAHLKKSNLLAFL